MEIQTARLKMAQITNRDWELFEELNRDPAVINLCFDEPAPSEIKEKFESRLPLWCKASEHWLCLTMTILETGEKIGVTGFRFIDNIAEVGYLILPKYHGVGFGTESLKSLINWASNEQKIRTFSAVVTEGNISSEKVLINSGFSLREIVPNNYEIGGELYADRIYIIENIAT